MGNISKINAVPRAVRLPKDPTKELPSNRVYRRADHRIYGKSRPVSPVVAYRTANVDRLGAYKQAPKSPAAEPVLSWNEKADFIKEDLYLPGSPPNHKFHGSKDGAYPVKCNYTVKRLAHLLKKRQKRHERKAKSSLSDRQKEALVNANIIELKYAYRLSQSHESSQDERFKTIAVKAKASGEPRGVLREEAQQILKDAPKNKIDTSLRDAQQKSLSESRKAMRANLSRMLKAGPQTTDAREETEILKSAFTAAYGSGNRTRRLLNKAVLVDDSTADARHKYAERKYDDPASVYARVGKLAKILDARENIESRPRREQVKTMKKTFIRLYGASVGDRFDEIANQRATKRSEPTLYPRLQTFASELNASRQSLSPDVADSIDEIMNFELE